MNNIIKKEVVFPYLTKPVEIYERENGHKIVFAHKLGGLINVSTWVQTGSINEDDKNNGISHFLEHLMFKGTPTHPAGEFDRLLESKGAIVNAATWKDYTFYYVTIPKGVNDNYFNLALELHADMMLNSIIPEEEIGEVFNINEAPPSQKRERHVVIEEIGMREDQPWSKVYNALNNAMYDKHPYKRDVIGTAEIISQVSRDEIYSYYKKFYAPNNMITIVVGDFDSEQVLNKVVELFNFDGVKKAEKYSYKEDLPTQTTKYIENYAQVNTGFVMVGYLCSKAKNLRDTILMDLVSVILGDGKSSRLNQNLIEKVKKSIFSYASTEHYHFKDGNNFFIQANFEADKKEEALDLIKKEIIDIIENPISEKELKKAKKKLMVNFADSAETVSEIADSLGYYLSVCDDLDLCTKYLDILENLTIEDVQETAKRYLNLDNATISVLMPQRKEV